MLLGLCQSQPAASLGSLVFRSITDVCFPEFFLRFAYFYFMHISVFHACLYVPHTCAYLELSYRWL